MELSKYLRPEHREAGLTLSDNEDFVWLKYHGEEKAVWSSLTPTLIADILHEADQILNWSVSGVSFGKEK